MYLKCAYHQDSLHVDTYPNILPLNIANSLLSYLDPVFPTSYKRESCIFGDEGIVYQVQYLGSEKVVIPWEKLPGLTEIKQLIETTTQQKYNVCIIQKYPNGKIGIAPHRDKEITPGNRIAGLSLGATRILEFTRDGYDSLRISLPSGSLYVMQPPTNEKWLHSIIKEPEIKDSRFSLTFREYK